MPLAEALKTSGKARKDTLDKIEELLDANQKKTLKSSSERPSGFGGSHDSEDDSADLGGSLPAACDDSCDEARLFARIGRAPH